VLDAPDGALAPTEVDAIDAVVRALAGADLVRIWGVAPETAHELDPSDELALLLDTALTTSEAPR